MGGRGGPSAWVVRRWHDLEQRPSGNAVPGTVTVAVLGGLVGLALVAGAAWRADGPVALLETAIGPPGLAIGCAALYHLAARADLGRVGRLTGVAFLLANPDLVGTVTDPRRAVLLAGILAALAGLARWVTATRTPSGGELAVYVGVPATAAAFAGYEGWLLVGVGAVTVSAVEITRRHGVRSALTRAVCVAATPVLVGAWWVVRELAAGTGATTVLPAPGATLAAGSLVSLACLLLAVSVLASITGLVRDERHRQTLALGARPSSAGALGAGSVSAASLAAGSMAAARPMGAGAEA